MISASLPPPPALRAQKVAVFLDVDGTLLEIAARPDAVRVPNGLRQLLGALAVATEGAMALVSGRPIAELAHLFAPLDLPLAGLHGLERRRVGEAPIRATPDRQALAKAKARLVAFSQRHPGTLVEDKGLTLALHYRNAPEHQGAAAALVGEVIQASSGALVLLAGKMVFELKPPGCDKGQAIACFMQEPPFAGRLPIFAGDDVTDEAGFLTVNELHGVSIRIGLEGRPTAARFGQADVEALQGWLAGLLAQPHELGS